MVKAYQLYRVTRDSKISAVSIVLEHFTGLLGLSAMSVVTLVIGYQRLNSPLILGAVVGTAVLLVGIAGLIWYLPTAPVASWIVDRVVPLRVARTLRETQQHLVSYRSHPRTLLGGLISSLLHLLCAASPHWPLESWESQSTSPTS